MYLYNLFSLYIYIYIFFFFFEGDFLPILFLVFDIVNNIEMDWQNIKHKGRIEFEAVPEEK